MLRPFRIPETRLLVINDLVVQVTVTFRTDEDEEMRYRYAEDEELQSLVQTSVISLVNCGYTDGIARGPGFVLYQKRKKWPIGRRYIFTRHGEPLQSSLHKYFFQLELLDWEGQQHGNVVEITELRGVGMSPSSSSIAGSTIEGLEAVALPPMSAIFGQGVPSEELVPTPKRSNLAQSDFTNSHQKVGENSADDFSLFEADLDNGYKRTQHSSVGNGSTMQQNTEDSPDLSTAGRTRTLSRSSVGSVDSNTGRNMIETEERVVGRQTEDSGSVGRLGRTSWYRSLHGISPLSRPAKSLSSENEIGLGVMEPPQIPRVAGTPHKSPGTNTGQSLPPPVRGAESSGLGSIAQRFRRKLLSPIPIPRVASRLAHASDAGSASESEPAEGSVRDTTAAEGKRKLATEAPRTDMPPPRKRPAHVQPTKESEIELEPETELEPESKQLPSRRPSVPEAVKNALWRRLRTPLSRRADTGAPKLSVRERIAAFNSLSVRGRGTTVPSSQSVLTPVTESYAEDSEIRSSNNSPIQEKSKQIKAATIRTRVGTTTGFLSVAAPKAMATVENQHQSHTNNSVRADSPALSQMSSVSSRVQDTINALERAGVQVQQQDMERSGIKRPAESGDALTSPTKRPRAPSVGTSRRNPLRVMHQMVRRHTGR
ncbi:hypothetical protein COEREDRAFT_82845 [Coemansia reversa NRRL 1564]|uniref:Uncharacterized protein n=1 Tax=Coemansia reversa (strain ATCC 12441 / NRRL 1564) TaxID=763665 RepID=A0A2G5B5R1_COERN|nr:hypothetical protein COEREDRAFT_82845 [Coemansia reversa NRRL 1564]|eukprot:PIA14332.1 hypothetical protein COEREDRAFT_82845 [Coemansia reversa NRRL 1564]